MGETIIHTGLYSETAYHILSHYWKQVRNKYPRQTWFFYGIIHSNIEQAIDNEVIIHYKIPDWRNTPAFRGKPDKEIFTNLAWRLKEMTRNLLGRDAWNRTSHIEMTLDLDAEVFKDCNHPKVTVTDIYFLYDYLLKRDLNKHFSKQFIEDSIGIPLDPIMVEMKKTQQDEVLKLLAEKEQKRDAFYAQRMQELQAFRQQLEQKYDAINAMLDAEYSKKIEDLKASLVI